jgi:hypothetical protein
MGSTSFANDICLAAGAGPVVAAAGAVGAGAVGAGAVGAGALGADVLPGAALDVRDVVDEQAAATTASASETAKTRTAGLIPTKVERSGA